MRKGVAVPYIIALILGVAVIGLVGYWFATTGGKFGGQTATTICENKFLQYCITKDPSKTWTDFVSEVTECQSISSSYTQCSEITTGGFGGPGPPPPPPGPDCGDADTHGSCGAGQYCNGVSCVLCVDGVSPTCSGDCNKCGPGWLCEFGGICGT